MDTSILGIFKSACFWSPCIAWTIAQTTKMFVGFSRTRRLDFSYIMSTGGMPSAHSAMVSALAASVGMLSGFNKPIFDVALAFALITMFDASTVRRAAGQQARLLNQVVDSVFKEHKFPEKKLKELLGHTRVEVFVGMLVGILVAVIVTSFAASL